MLPLRKPACRWNRRILRVCDGRTSTLEPECNSVPSRIGSSIERPAVWIDEGALAAADQEGPVVDETNGVPAAGQVVADDLRDARFDLDRGRLVGAHARRLDRGLNA